MLFMFKDGETTRIIPDTDPSVHTIYNSTDDCDGDVLWDYMFDHGIIDDWSEYDTEGDRESCAVIHKTGNKPDYRWEFREYVAPGPASDDCHSFS
jgi:hypothetical protein